MLNLNRIGDEGLECFDSGTLKIQGNFAWERFWDGNKPLKLYPATSKKKWKAQNGHAM